MKYLFTVILALLAFTSTLHAQPFPERLKPYVNDYAGLLSDQQERDLTAQLQAFQQEIGVEMEVITIHSMQDFGHSGKIEPFATDMFNSWGIGNAARNDGVMFLVARNDRVLRIEVGSGYGRSKDRAMKRIIETVIVPEFKRDDYADGIAEGVTAVIAEISGGSADGAHVDTPKANIFQRIFDTVGNWIYLALAPVAGLGTWLFRRWMRYRPRRCPNDGYKMQLIAEEWDDQYLKDGQIVEEDLGSVDYDVWWCESCDHHTVEAYKKWGSKYHACRTCGYKTVESDSTTLRSATRSSTGLKRVDYFCKQCSDAWSVEKTIPRITSSSSSSGGSSGGGSSSGGGASGSW